jgi:NAD(P)H-hydrate epimerase
VFYPYQPGNGRYAVRDALGRAVSAAFGSGSDNNQDIDDIFLLLLCSDIPLVLDAAALKLINAKRQIIEERTAPVIITPHRGEFAALYPQGASAMDEDPVKAAADCAAELGIITVLKGPNTIVASPEGRVYVNQTGSQGLAQAGSGDVLTGMTAAMLSFVKDPFEAACMAVFAHGMAADRLCLTHSRQTMPLEKMPEAMDGLFFKHGF